MYRLYIQQTPDALRIAIKKNGELWSLKLVPSAEKVHLNQIYVAQVSSLAKGIAGVFLDLGDDQAGFLNQDDAQLQEGQELKPGQTRIVQIKRLGEGNKQHLTTADIKLMGLQLIYLPRGNVVRFSKRFSGDRQAIELAFKAAELTEAGGWIVRSGASERGLDALLMEAQSLAERWQALVQDVQQSGKARMLFAEHPVLEAIFAYASEGIDAIYFEDGPFYEDMRERIKEHAHELLAKLERPIQGESVFDRYQIQSEMERALQNRVWLKSGAYLDFQITAAMVTVDVNTGKNTKPKAEMKANLEACAAIAYQLRLREWGGLVAIDFASTPHKTDRQALDKALRNAFADDPEPTQFQPTNAFFVAMLSRRKSGASWSDFYLTACPYCKTTPRFGHPWTLDKLNRGLYQYRESAAPIQLQVHSKLHEHLQQHAPDWLESAQRLHQLSLQLEINPQFTRVDQFDIQVLDE